MTDIERLGIAVAEALKLRKLLFLRLEQLRESVGDDAKE